MGFLDERQTYATHDHDIEWPRWLPIGSAALPIALGVGVLVQRDALSPPETSTILLVGLVVLPWILDAVAALVPRWGRLPEPYLPRSIFAAAVIAGTGALLQRPTELDFVPFFLVLLAAEMACLLPRWQSAVVVGAAVALMVGMDLRPGWDGSLIWVFGILFGWFGGLMIRSQVVLTTELKATQAELAEKAAADERRRIAREIHDVVAHSLTVTMLHVTGARLALRRDPEDAQKALEEAERLGRQSLQDIRRTVGLLDPDADATGSPAPGVEDLPELVSGYAAAGLDVHLHRTGELDGVPEATGLGLYRIVQESLTNVAKHASGGRADVRLRVDDELLTLQVRNALGNGRRPSVPEGGLGIQGMRERAETLGGELRAGPDGEGWLVELTVPLEVTP